MPLFPELQSNTCKHGFMGSLEIGVLQQLKLLQLKNQCPFAVCGTYFLVKIKFPVLVAISIVAVL